MRLGYACINRSLPCKANRSFRLASLTPQRFWSTVEQNLDCLGEILRFNLEHGLLFFRISSDIIPFASHPAMTLPWQARCRSRLQALGDFCNRSGMRISMHPDQFILLNSPDRQILDSSLRELYYHADFLQGMGLDQSAKIQVHVGGVYGDKPAALARFREQVVRLEPRLRQRLAVENDDVRFSLRECLQLHAETGVPVIFDSLHHALLHEADAAGAAEGLALAAKTWKSGDGPPMVDYASPDPLGRRGKHAEHLDPEDFLAFIQETKNHDFDLMLEIKDKEASAISALLLIRDDPRLVSSAKA